LGKRIFVPRNEGGTNKRGGNIEKGERRNKKQEGRNKKTKNKKEEIKTGKKKEETRKKRKGAAWLRVPALEMRKRLAEIVIILEHIF